MKIEAISTFIDGQDRFEKDDVRTVDDTRGAYFVAQGWARDTSGRVAIGATLGNAELTINKATVGMGDTNG